jgi:hypothetical protein
MSAGGAGDNKIGPHSVNVEGGTEVRDAF